MTDTMTDTMTGMMTDTMTTHMTTDTMTGMMTDTMITPMMTHTLTDTMTNMITPMMTHTLTDTMTNMMTDAMTAETTAEDMIATMISTKVGELVRMSGMRGTSSAATPISGIEITDGLERPSRHQQMCYRGKFPCTGAFFQDAR